ncbi:SH3 domain-containing protein [Anaeromassilibacillus senegalensis]|uniref:SH3 domain-containing protein n=1 Tax=Anaeromassilibacillus senegalensis TaxID=1673717 RepID=UPI002E1C8DE7
MRSGPGTNYPVIGQIKDKKRYTIVKEKTGTGSSKGWGRLKAGGWVARDWIKKA